MDLDIAIVGGGVSGAYSAWRLQQEKGAEASIGLFEYSDRIGGRLYTVTLPGLPHVKAEVGGMRYIPDEHIMVANLVDHLQIPTKDFPMGAPPPVGSNCNLFYLRGRHFRLRELARVLGSRILALVWRLRPRDALRKIRLDHRFEAGATRARIAGSLLVGCCRASGH